MRYVAGELLNFLEQARAITPSPTADADFPASRLYDGQLDAVFAFSANSADPKITIDLAMLGADGEDNGNLDAWSASEPTGWTVTTEGTGAVVETTTAGEIRSGSAAKLSKGSDGAAISKRFRVRAGQRLNLSVWLRAAGSGAAKAQLRNLTTGKYLTAASAWQAAQVYVGSETGTSYVETALAFRVEDLAACQAAIVLLELTISDQGAGGGSDYAFADDCFLWPAWNAIIVPPFYGYLSTASAKRWARLQLAGVQSEAAVYLGELIVSYLETGAYQSWGFTTRNLPDNIRNPAGGRPNATRAVNPPHNVEPGLAPVLQSSTDGSSFSTEASLAVLGSSRRRALALRFEGRTQAEAQEVLEEIHGRCHGSLWPLVLVPVDDEAAVIFGRLEEEYDEARPALSAWDADLLLAEAPFPRVVPG